MFADLADEGDLVLDLASIAEAELDGVAAFFAAFAGGDGDGVGRQWES